MQFLWVRGMSKLLRKFSILSILLLLKFEFNYPFEHMWCIQMWLIKHFYNIYFHFTSSKFDKVWLFYCKRLPGVLQRKPISKVLWKVVKSCCPLPATLLAQILNVILTENKFDFLFIYLFIFILNSKVWLQRRNALCTFV